MRRTFKRTTVLSGLIAIIMGLGVAFAAWTSTGNGSGAATSRTHVDSVIAAADSAALLYPGATDVPITVSISNPNPYPVTVLTISGGSSQLVNGCAAGTVTTKAVDPVPTNNIAAKVGSTNGSGTYTLLASMAHNATDACKSQTFTFTLSATLESNVPAPS